ncbi:F-box-like domain superfamily [Arabidopsis thaliana x Arabidopsis arenosa]|uniref:F-box-like domain superfamily n=1 Tax=Arabidopsis thaliana x Arabidopsis arenosa TaxID=1240361 RepID=A0A8T2CE17_9BRAS|nr:F-box-like domain superfamily [Arabidopsis thaliana x Arabidopsis arenosa]
MRRGENSDSFPNDLIPEILSRLPAKSIARFRCVSKLWESMLSQPYFTELFHTRSSSNPRLLIGVEQGGVWSFFSSPQPQNHYGKSSLVVASDFHMKFSEDRLPFYRSYASGLIYFPNMWISSQNDHVVRVICNPSTGQYVILPLDLTTTPRNINGLLGFDPIGKQFKVLVHNRRVNDELVYHILTLGTENLKWREIKFPLFCDLSSEMICINGVLYYLTSGGFLLKLHMWVLEDVEKHEWTRYAYTVRAENLIKDNDYINVVGATASGEIVLAKKNACKPFSVLYFNPEKNTLLSVEIQGVGKEEEWFDYHSVYYFVDHVEDIKFDVMKKTYAATSIS